MRLLTKPWSRDTFAAFAQKLVDRSPIQKIGLTLPRHARLFAKLEGLAENPKRITAQALVSALGVDGTRRNQLVLGFLLNEGVISVTALEIQEAAEEGRHQRILDGAAPFWYGPILLRFHANMMRLRARFERRGWTGNRQRFTLETISRALRAAALFLSDCSTVGIASAQSITTDEVDRFCLNRPGYRPTLARFVRFLNVNEKLFNRVEIELIPVGFTPGLLISTQKYQELLAAWIAPEPDQIKPAIICLLLLLYAQPVRDVVRVKQTDLKLTEKGLYRVTFRRAEITLHQDVSAMLARYMKERRPESIVEDASENDYVFPGRLATDHLSEAAITHHLKKHGVNARQLFSSAVHQFCLRGHRQPKVLVRGLGISMPTALKYMGLVQPRLSAELEADRALLAAKAGPSAPSPDPI